MRSASFLAVLFVSAFFIMLAGLNSTAQSRMNQTGPGWKAAIEELETYLKLVPKAQDAEKVKKDISDIKAKHIKNAFV